MKVVIVKMVKMMNWHVCICVDLAGILRGTHGER